MSKSLGENICALRKEKGATQEDLAKAVGISTQAVSKWECGGMPDPELFPAIADFFGTSIDRLFGRSISEYGDLETELAKHFAELNQRDGCLFEVMEYCWIIQRALIGVNPHDDDLSLRKIYENNSAAYQYSRMDFDCGFSTLSLVEKMPYYFLMPKPKTGWLEGFFEPEQYAEAFSFLSDVDTLKCLLALYKRKNKPFTPKYFEKKLNIPAEKSKLVLESLKRFSFISESEIELDDGTEPVYNFHSHLGFIALLAVAKETIKPPKNMVCYCQNHNWEMPLL